MAVSGADRSGGVVSGAVRVSGEGRAAVVPAPPG